jgi:hypothetical protein
MHHPTGYNNRRAKNNGRVRTVHTRFLSFVSIFFFAKLSLRPIFFRPLTINLGAMSRCAILYEGSNVENGCCTQPMEFFFLGGPNYPPNFVSVRGWKWEGWGQIKPLLSPITGAGPLQLRLPLLSSRSFSLILLSFSRSLPLCLTNRAEIWPLPSSLLF